MKPTIDDIFHKDDLTFSKISDIINIIVGIVLHIYSKFFMFQPTFNDCLTSVLEWSNNMIKTCEVVDTQLLASVSLFKSLYNQNKDIFDLLSIFVKYIIKKKRLHTFTEIDIYQALKEEFCFEIPLSVLTTVIRNRIKAKKEYGFYSIAIDTNDNLDDISNRIELANLKNANLLKMLVDYVSKKTGINLSKEDERVLLDNFCNYQLNNSFNGIYSNYISEFIINCNSDSAECLETMNETCEGLVIYKGIMNSNNLNEIGLWKNKLTVFCDMDILFSYFGYNGTVYSEIISPFFKLANEINCNPKTVNNIKLLYFRETKREIDRFFDKACLILERKENIDPSKNAMLAILNGCQTTSDVLEKKAIFSSFLKKNGILEYDSDFYDDSSNHLYNIIDTQMESMFTEKYGKEEDYISLLLCYINYINMLRKGDNSKPIESTGFVFLSSNLTLIKMDKEIQERFDERYPKAVTPDNMITTLWFHLKKGFGSLEKISSINVVKKAQIILSSQINLNVAKEYKGLSERMASGEIDKDAAIEYLAELQNRAKKPEQITSEFLDENDVLFVSSEEIETKIRENKLLKSQNQQLEAKLRDYSENEQKHINNQKDLEKELEVYREKERKQNERHLANKKRIKKFLYLLILILIFIFSTIFVLFNEISPIKEICVAIGTISGIMTILGFCGLTPSKIINLLKK